MRDIYFVLLSMSKNWKSLFLIAWLLIWMFMCVIVIDNEKEHDLNDYWSIQEMIKIEELVFFEYLIDLWWFPVIINVCHNDLSRIQALEMIKSILINYCFFFMCLSLKGTYHLWISRFDFCHFWYSKTTILSKNKNAFKFKKLNLKAEI